MDNWDFMEENLATAANSSGDLQEQADIYAESWEAAQKRVKTALQAIYSDLIDDNFFIGLSDNFAKLLEVIDKVINSMGGVKGVLASVGGILLSLYASKMPAAIDNLKANFWVFTGQAKKAMLQVQNKTEEYLKTIEQGNYSLAFKTQAEGLAKVDAMQQKLILNASNMTEQEQDAYKLVIQNVQAMYKEAEAASKVVQALQEKVDIEKKQALNNTVSGAKQIMSDYLAARDNQIKWEGRVDDMSPEDPNYHKAGWSLEDAITETEQLEGQVNNLFTVLGIKSIKAVNLTKNNVKEVLKEIQTGVQNVANNFDELYQERIDVDSISVDTKGEITLWEKEAKNIGNNTEKLEILKKKIKEYIDTVVSKNSRIGEEDVITNLQKEIDNLDIGNLENFLNRLKEAFNLEGVLSDIDNDIAAQEANVQTISGEENTFNNYEKAVWDVKQTNKELDNSLENVRLSAEEIPQSTTRASVAWTEFASAIMSTYTAINSIKSLFSTFNEALEGNASAIEVFSALLATAGSLIPTIATVSKYLTTAFGAQAIVTNGAAVAQWSLNAAIEANPVGAAVVAITALIAAIAAGITIYNELTMSVKEADEAIESLNEDMKNFASESTSFQDNISDLEDMQSEYDKLSAKAGKYDQYIQNLTESERKRYNEIKESIVNYNEDMLAYWNDQGEAILKNNDGLQQTIDLLQEKYELERAEIYNTNFDERTEAYDVKYKSTKKDLEEAKDYQEAVTSDYLSTGQGYEDYALAEIINKLGYTQSEVWDYGLNNNEINNAFSSIRGLIEQGATAILAANSDGTLDAYIKTITSAFDGTPYEYAMSAIEQELENIVVQAKDIQKTVDDANAEVAKAQSAFESASSLSVSWVLGVIKYNKENNQGYQQLQAQGVENADSFITAYLNGITLGITKDLNGNVIETTQDVYDAVNLFEDELATYFIDIPNSSFTKASQDFSKQNFSSYQDYIDAVTEAIIKFFEENPTLINASEEVKEAIFKSLFGTGDLVFDEDGSFVKVAPEDKFETFKEKFYQKTNLSYGLISDEELRAAIPYDQLDNLDAIIDKIDVATIRTKGWEIALQEAISEVKNDEIIADYDSKISTTSDIIKTLLSGEELSEDQLTSLQSLEDEYGELATIQDKNSTAYLNKLLEIREALEAEQIELKKTREASKINDALEIKVKTNGGEAELQNALEEICNADYEVLVSVKTDAQDNFDATVTAIENIETAASKIGENFIVAGKDIEELGSVFPGILANVEFLGDGTVRINEEVAKSAMETAKAEVIAAADTTAEKLQLQADEMATKRDAARTIANIAKKITEGESTAAQQQGNINQALNQLKSDNSEEVSEQEQEDSSNVADAAAQAATSQANSFGKAYEVMAKDAVTWAEAAHQSLKYATDLDAEAPEIGTFGGASFSTTANITTTTSEKADLSTYEDYNTVDDWKVIEDYYDNLAKSYDKAYNNFLSKKAEILARGQGTTSTLGDISSGKGTSSSSSSKNKQDTKKYSDEFDRYHDIKETIEEVEDAVSDLGRQQKHLFGNELANNLREQNALLEQQAADYRILAAMQKEEQQELQATLSQYGMAFDQQTGLTTNYAQVTAAALAEMNAAIEAYNVSAQEEADKTALEAAEDRYDAFKKALERYDSLVDEIRDTENNLDDLYYTQVANTLDAWEAEIEIKLDLSEAKRTWEEFIDEISDDFTSVYKDISKNMSSLVEQAKTYMGTDGTIATDLANVQHAQDFINQAQGMNYDSDAFRNLAVTYGYASISEAQDKLKEYNETLQDDASDLYGLYENTWDTYIEGIDQAVDKFDKLTEAYDNINDNLDHQSKLIELLYGEQAYDYLNQLYTAESENLLGKMNNLAQQIKFYQQQYENAVSTYGEDSEAAEKFKDAWTSALDDLNSTEEEYLESIQNKALNAIDKIFDELDSRLTGGSSLSWLSEQWEDATKAAEGYYDDVERIYQLEALEQKFNKAINDASSLKSQQALKTILDEQLASLENKTTLSEYDIELAEKRLAVYQAQIALEDAQNNKTSMKLIRNEAGNWTYQYTADEDDVQSKQEALMQAQNEYYEFTKSSWEDLTNTILEDTQTAVDRIKELEEESITATTERQAEIAEQIEYLREYYWGSEGVITKEIAEHAEYEDNLNQATAETLWGLYDIDVENFTLMTDTEKDLINQLKDYGVNNFQTLYDAVAQNYDDIQSKCDEVNAESLNTWTTTAAEMCRVWASDDEDSVKTAVTSALVQCDQAVVDYATLVQIGCAAAQDNFANVGEQIYQDQLATYALEGQTEQLVQSTVDNLTVYAQYLAEIQSMWQGVADQIANATQAAIAYLAVQGIEASVKTTTTSTTATGSTGTAQTITPSTTNNSASGKNNSNNESIEEEVKNNISSNKKGYYFHNNGLPKVDLYAVPMDTGGYTGEWPGGGGELAILHSKELVLNSSDTENLLSAVNTVCSIVGASNSITQAIAGGIAKMMYNVNGLSASSGGSNYSNKSNENNVFNITAEFPNAENVNEIREAIMSLPTLASQYLSKNLK